MTDPQNPGTTPPPPASGAAPVPPAPAATPAPASYGQPAAPPYGAAPQPYAAAPPAGYGAPVSPSVPGKTLGIVAFILSFFMQFIALILGIIAMVQSKKAGAKNGFALAAIIISSVLMLVGIIIIFAVIVPLVSGAEDIVAFCAQNGDGVFEFNGVPIDCSELLSQ
ncbi:DUF4190 domain-containing protein (plasmid) [Coraliomargarita sp. W4R53]